jgi:hypothetical protein
MRIQLLSFPGCLHADNARRALRKALASVGLEESFEEVDTTSPATPAPLRAWGSPTILIDGADVAGGTPSGASCRIYPPSELPGAPLVAMIVERLRAT